jgi:hypothetical protein
VCAPPLKACKKSYICVWGQKLLIHHRSCFEHCSHTRTR